MWPSKSPQSTFTNRYGRPIRPIDAPSASTIQAPSNVAGKYHQFQGIAGSPEKLSVARRIANTTKNPAAQRNQAKSRLQAAVLSTIRAISVVVMGRVARNEPIWAMLSLELVLPTTKAATIAAADSSPPPATKPPNNSSASRLKSSHTLRPNTIPKTTVTGIAHPFCRHSSQNCACFGAPKDCSIGCEGAHARSSKENISRERGASPRRLRVTPTSATKYAPAAMAASVATSPGVMVRQ
jgi:hypothetical protein